MSSYNTLQDLFINAFATNGGLFQHFSSPPWGSSLNLSSMDIEFFTRYGDRIASNFVEHFSTFDPSLGRNVIQNSDVDKICSILSNHFYENWTRMYGVYTSSYVPIENYKMVETETLSASENVDDSTTIESTINSDTTQSNSETANTFAYDSSTAVPTDSGSSTSTLGNDTTNNSTNVRDFSKTNSNDRELTRSGNIGVTTSQQMLESEIDLWKWSYIQSIFDDVLKLLTIPIYII